MDMALDSKQSKAFDCSICDRGMQKLRNCGGNYKKSRSPMKVNNQVYFQCPRSMTFGKDKEQLIVEVYFDCKENKVWPYGKSIMDQTAFCKASFEFLDRSVGEYRARMDAEHERKMNSSSKSKTK